MSTSQEFTAEQLAAARAARWHQNGEGLLTIESLRDWINDFGLVLYVPRSLQIPAPAASFAEATLGAANPGPGVAELEQARSLLARLAAEGTALPLNLLGSVGDTPDFLVSTQMFSYIFTLRGDKSWKLPPATTGAVKVSPLGLNTYEALAAGGAMSTAQLVTELGREVTEVAVIRALSELWGQLRVLPVPQTDGSTVWELTSKRFTKQIKAGINAGQPKALSALISLYLRQAVAATEEEVVTFLSPLAARSRIREVLHALMAGQQLETVVLEGKTLLHVAGELPVFEALPVAESAEPVGSIAAEAMAATTETPAPRISKYKAKMGAERERRPFRRDGAAPAKPSFTKPWEEEKAARPAAMGDVGEGRAFPAKREYGERPPRKTFGEKPGFGARTRPSFGDRDSRPPRKSFGDKPSYSPRPSFGGDLEGGPPRKTYGDKPSFGARPRPSFGDRDSRPPRKSFGDKRSYSPRPSFGGDREGGPPRKTYGDKPSFGARPRPSFGDRDNRPPRKSFGDKPSYSPRTSFGGDRGDRPRKTFEDKPSFGARPRPSFGDRDSRPPRKSFGDKPSYSPRPSFGDSRPPRKTFGDKPAYRPRSEGEGERKPFRKFDAPGGERKPFRKFDAPRFDAPGGERKSYSKPGGFAGKKFGDKPGGFDKPKGKFAGKPYTGKPKGKFGSYTKPKYPGLPTGSGPKPARPRRKTEDEAGS